MSTTRKVRHTYPRHPTRLARAALLFAAAAATPSVQAAAAEWSPSRPIRFINVMAAGGSQDAVARLVGQRMAETLGQQVVVDNRAGAGGVVGVEIAARAVPDGHTIVIAASSMTTYRLSNPGLTFDPMKDLAPVSLIASAPLVLCTHLSVPASNGRELIAWLKARPGKANFASSGNSTSSHLAGELFKTMAGVEMTHVPYKGAGPAINDLIAGQTQIMFSSTLSMVPLVQGGRLRGLGVSSAKRLAVLPDVPAVAEYVPGYELAPWFGVFAPAATPKPIIERLARDIARALARPDVQEFYAKQGALAVHSTPAEFARYVQSEAVKWQTLVKQVGVAAGG
jgi:tripartite-type tricarboxylate transporter receptor subunit TctC